MDRFGDPPALLHWTPSLAREADELGLAEPPSRGTFAPGEEAARKQATAFLRRGR